MIEEEDSDDDLLLPLSEAIPAPAPVEQPSAPSAPSVAVSLAATPLQERLVDVPEVSPGRRPKPRQVRFGEELPARTLPASTKHQGWSGRRRHRHPGPRLQSQRQHLGRWCPAWRRLPMHQRRHHDEDLHRRDRRPPAGPGACGPMLFLLLWSAVGSLFSPATV